MVEFDLVSYLTMHSLFFCSWPPDPCSSDLDPTSEQIEDLHQTYMEELRKLFEEHKGKYGIPENEALIFR